MRPLLHVDGLRVLDRRTLLMGLGAAGTAVLLPSCGSSKSKSSTPSPTSQTDWGSFDSLQAFVRSSADHLPARAAELIAAKDYSGAVRFVRDNIAVLPPNAGSDEAPSFVRWGPDAALRAGAGTQRERADVLAAMLTAMGASAKIYTANLPAGVDAAALYALRPPSSSLNLDALEVDAALKAKLSALPATMNDPDPSTLIASLMAMLPAGQALASQPFAGIPDSVPVIEYTVGGTTKWAFALASIDEVASEPDGLVKSDASPATYPPVSVRLLAAFGDIPGVAAPTNLIELVAATWTADQVAGGRMFITTQSADPSATAGVPIDQVTLRAPLLSVQQSSLITNSDPAIWTPNAATAPKAAGGAAFAMTGAHYTPAAKSGDPIAGPYGTIIQLDTSAHAAALASVTRLAATAAGGAFPDIQLTVSAHDAAGTPVFGLLQSDFAVTDEGATQGPVLLANAGTDLKVMLAYDCSSSVTWPTPKDRTDFESALANAMVTSAATTSFQLGYASLGSTPTAYAAPDAATIQTDIAGCFSTSDLWTALGDTAPKQGISAVVLVSDFVATDDPLAIPALKQRLAANGLSVALVPISTDVDQATVDAIVQTCGATVLDWTAADFQEKLTAFVTDAATRANEAGYRSTYRLPSAQQTNQATRKVNVALASNSAVTASAQYTVPPADSRGSLGIAGLYLEISIGYSKAVRRRLSGPLLDSAGSPLPPTQADFDMTRALLNGQTTVAFEPGSPTESVNADELIASMKSTKAVADADGTPVAQSTAALQAMRPYHAAMAGLVNPLPLPTSNSMVTPKWLRVAIMTDFADDGGVERHFDVVPDLNLSVLAEPDAAKAFAATMSATVPLSFREGVVLSSSAATDLTSAPLQYLPPFTGSAGLSGFTAADLATWSGVFEQYTGWHRFVPKDPAAGAMWVVDPDTGTTVAVYVNGTGGGCAKALTNAGIQAAVAILAYATSMRWFTCDELEDPYPCLGWTTASVIAGANGFLAGAALDDISYADLAILIGSFLSFGFGAWGTAVGWAVSAVGGVVVLHEGSNSIDEHCFG